MSVMAVDSSPFRRELHHRPLVRQRFCAMRRGSKIEPDTQGAFCRVITIDEDDAWIEMSERESVRPGVIPDLIDRLAVFNHVIFPSMVARRLQRAWMVSNRGVELCRQRRTLLR